MKDLNQDKSVALEYGNHKVPRVIAKAQGDYSSIMRETARELKIPILRDSNLAALLEDVELDGEIPEELFEMVAIILSWAYWLRDKKPDE
jgi:flagellar biosynthesis protein